MSRIEKRLKDVEQEISDIRHDIAEDKEEIWLTPTRDSFGNGWAGDMGLTRFDRVLLIDSEKHSSSNYLFTTKTRKGVNSGCSAKYFEEAQTLGEMRALHNRIK